MKKPKFKVLVAEEDPGRVYTEFPGEITARTQAAIDLVRVASATGILERLPLALSLWCGKFGAQATDSSRREERRNIKWRGQGKGTEFEDPTSTGGDGDSRYWDQRATEGLRALERKRMLRKRRRDIGGSSREE